MELFSQCSKVLVYCISGISVLCWTFILIVLLKLRTRSAVLESMEDIKKLYSKSLPENMAKDIFVCTKWIKIIHAVLLTVICLLWFFSQSAEQAIAVELAFSNGRILCWTVLAMLMFAIALPAIAAGRSTTVEMISTDLRKTLPFAFVLTILYCIVNWLLA